jgi:hypothetical protein
MNSEKKYTFQKEIFFSKKNNLSIHDKGIIYDFYNWGKKKRIEILKENITDYRYGIKWIRGFEFIIGRQYQIFIKDINNKTTRFIFRTYYGIRKKELHSIYSGVHSDLWELFFREIGQNYISKLENKEDFCIGDVKFSEKGVTIKVSGFASEEEKLILWDDLETKDYHTYFTIFSKKNAININRGYSYMNDWNTDLLFNVIGTYLNNKSS